MTSRGSDAARLPGERALIDHIRRRLSPPPSSLIVGVGDDAAVMVPERGAFQVLTTDAIVEGVHFDRRFSSLSDIGFKAVAVNLSDIAAMGAAPAFALLSLILPDHTTLGEVDSLLDGVLEAAGAARVALVGGNISRSPGPLVIDVTATGSVRPRRILTRAGGRPGDALYVTGTIGAAAAGLGWLRSHGPAGPAAHDQRLAGCIRRHQRPEPRVRLGMLLGRNRAASACMDLSDGLADAVRQIAEASRTGALIDAAALPIDPAAADWFQKQGLDPVTAAVSEGDDYELLFAVPRKYRGRLRTVQAGARGLSLTRIGELTGDPAVLLTRDGQSTPMPAGFRHF
ncbi:MAG TPA: thiamine-phosphate kinase [Vicinamibacterales bacterium]|nr:thiamine-phosphate kinase [Vicinamibacterales bacterium]